MIRCQGWDLLPARASRRTITSGNYARRGEVCMSVPGMRLPAARQRELRAIRETNEKAERPPYAWARLAAEDIPWLIAEHGWSVTDAPGERVDLRHANLTGVSLAGMQLRFARFDHAMLYQADLRGTDFF